MLTLFTAITGGMNWEDAMASLRDARLHMSSGPRFKHDG